MSGISSIGGQTDLDIFMYQSLAAERKPIEELEKTKSELRKKDNVYTDLKAKLREFDTIVKKLIDVMGKEGKLIVDCGAWFDEAKHENVKAMVDFTKEYGVYN